jgi:hypothetical protein
MARTHGECATHDARRGIRRGVGAQHLAADRAD